MKYEHEYRMSSTYKENRESEFQGSTEHRRVIARNRDPMSRNTDLLYIEVNFRISKMEAQ